MSSLGFGEFRSSDPLFHFFRRLPPPFQQPLREHGRRGADVEEVDLTSRGFIPCHAVGDDAAANVEHGSFARGEGRVEVPLRDRVLRIVRFPVKTDIEVIDTEKKRPIFSPGFRIKRTRGIGTSSLATVAVAFRVTDRVDNS